MKKMRSRLDPDDCVVYGFPKASLATLMDVSANLDLDELEAAKFDIPDRHPRHKSVLGQLVEGVRVRMEGGLVCVWLYSWGDDRVVGVFA